MYPFAWADARVVREKPCLANRNREEVIIPDAVTPESVNRDESGILRAKPQSTFKRIYPLKRTKN